MFSFVQQPFARTKLIKNRKLKIIKLTAVTVEIATVPVITVLAIANGSVITAVYFFRIPISDRLKVNI